MSERKMHETSGLFEKIIEADSTIGSKIFKEKIIKNFQILDEANHRFTQNYAALVPLTIILKSGVTLSDLYIPILWPKNGLVLGVSKDDSEDDKPSTITFYVIDIDVIITHNNK